MTRLTGPLGFPLMMTNQGYGSGAGGGVPLFPDDTILQETGDGLLLEDGTSYLLGDGIAGSTKISNLDAAGGAAGADEFPVVQSAANVAASMTQLKTLAATAASADYTYIASNKQSGVDPAVTKPTGTTSGDLLVYAISVLNGTPVSAGPEGSGWTPVYYYDAASTDYAALYYKIAGGSEAASYTWSTSGGGSSVAAVVSCFRGVTTPYDYCTLRSVGYAPSVLTTPGGLVLGVMHSTQGTITYSTSDPDTTLASNQSSATNATAIFYRTGVRHGGSGGVSINTISTEADHRIAAGVSWT